MSLRSILFGFSEVATDEADSFAPDLVTATSVSPVASLGPYAVAINGRQFTIDTSFEPYRREAFRHRSIASQRQSVQMTNIAGQGTVNTEGLWRREQTEWSMGAGQMYLDRKADSQETRFYQSKGVDVFSQPLQATLLPDTARKDPSTITASADIMLTRCGPYVVVSNGSTSGVPSVTVYTPTTNSPMTTWSAGTSITGFDASTTVNSIDSNDSYVYFATTTGIYFLQAGAGSTVTKYMANDVTTGYTGGYSLVRWANDQLICGNLNRLYAVNPRTPSGGSFPNYGAPAFVGDTSTPVTTISMTSGTATVTTKSAHGLLVGQPINFTNVVSSANISTIVTASGTGVATVTCSNNHGLNVGQPIVIAGNAHSTFNGTLSAGFTVASVTSNTVFTYNVNENNAVSTSNGGGTVQGSGLYGYNSSYVVATVPSTTTFTMTVPTSFSAVATGGEVVSSIVPDLLTTHQNPNWIWSDAASGETQVYFAGYVSNSSGKYSGCIYRSDLLGSSTTTASGVATITSSSVTQPFVLDTPVQALPMSPDEYPTALQSYLNYIFIGSNRGIRMAETLSIYDPTATATGDLKSGPLVPNILQPVTSPVTAIVGDGRYVWFAWNNYDALSTGLGKLDLSTFIAGDPLAPSYASDIMVTGQGIVNSLDWDPINNAPLMAIGGMGVYAPYATNDGGNLVVSQYVASGTLQSGIYSYGIPDPKIPVFFDFGAIAGSGSSVQAAITIDPLPVTPQGNNGTVINVGTYATSALEKSEFSIPPGYRGEQFITTITMNADPTLDTTPILYRWTLKAWPAAVSETEISAVLQLFSVDVVDGLEVYVDPYDSFSWLESLRQSQAIITYQEGPLTAQVVIETLDWIPHKRRDNWENGFEGDCVVTMKTIGGYQYTNPLTNAVTTTSYVYNEV